MRKLGKVTTSVVLSLIAVSCGPSGGSSGSPFTWHASTYTQDPIRNIKQDKNCIETFVLNDKASFMVPSFIMGVSSVTEIDLTGKLSGNYIKSPLEKPISISSYGEATSRVISLRFNSKLGDYEIVPERDIVSKVKSAKAELDVCPSTLEYNAFTYESAGLSAAASINKVYNMASSVGVNLEPIKLNIAPIAYEEMKYVGGPYKRNGVKGYNTDNAYYHPIDKEITFLPMSKTYQKLSKSKTPFWQMPMVGAHEYGHHIFTQLVTEFLPAEETQKAFSRNCFQGLGTVTHLHLSDEKQTEKIVHALGAINEGFADLVAFYALPKEESSMKGIKCFEDNRDVSISTFKDGTKKEFTYMVNFYIDSTHEFQKDSDCNTPDFQEIHHIGAIFAYQADKILSYKMVDKKEKFKVLMSWTEKLKDNYPEMKKLSDSEYLAKALELIEQARDEYLAKLP